MQVVMNVPYTAIHFATYESLKQFMHQALSEDGSAESQESLLVQVLARECAVRSNSRNSTLCGGIFTECANLQFGAGGLAGGLAAAATTPLDVVKTRLQLEGMASVTRYRTVSVVSNPAREYRVGMIVVCLLG
jgi:solute carrier family 25 iron transporter 28/37